MRALLLSRSLLISSSFAFARDQAIECPKGASSEGADYYLTIAITGNHPGAALTAFEGGDISEEMELKPSTTNATVKFEFAERGEHNDHDFRYTGSFDRNVFGEFADDVTVYLHSKSLMPR